MVCLPTIPSSGSSPALLDDSNPYTSGEGRNTCKTSPLTYLTLLLSSRGCRYAVAIRSRHISAACSHAHIRALQRRPLFIVQVESGVHSHRVPWRNRINLTSLTLFLTSPNKTSVRHLLDFLEGAIELGLATLTSNTQNGRLVPLKCLERMYINSSGPVSLLLDHLLIPVGARLRTRVHCPGIIRW